MAVRRLVVLALLLFALVFGIMLLLRSLVFTVVTPRDDAAYPLVAVAQALAGPRAYDVVLNDPRGLDGEEVVEGRAVLVVIVSPGPDRVTFNVVNATSPIDGERVQIAGAILIGADGSRWSLTGEPADPGTQALQRFPAAVDGDVVVVDFTRPDPPP
jgi:hypothetical protein